MSVSRKILVTGATGYVGGRLVPRLLEEGDTVHCLVRDPDRLQGRTWLQQVKCFTGDVCNPETLPPALEGVEIAYYLVHSMGGGAGYAERDREAAHAFATAAKEAGVQRIIYLGGLAKPGQTLSKHLQSRMETGEALREPGVPVTEFRAGVVVGSGSLSFEMIRYLTERVPFMICPHWVNTKAQPIGIRDVLDYLSAARNVPESTGRIIEIGGEEVLTYGEMMLGYAKARGLKRRMVPVPWLTPRLSSYWVHLVTPIPATIARPLILGLKNENVITDFSARTLFPDISPCSYGTSLQRALARLDAGEVETAWSDTIGGARPPVTLLSREGMILEQRTRTVPTSPGAAFLAVCSLGGQTGWLYMNWAWRLRGALDRLLGGVGMRRGRRDPVELRVGDALDFWRVEAVDPAHLLRLRAEMKVPGKAWLEFQIDPSANNSECVQLTQTAIFAPKGLSGLLYWYALYPIHSLIFSGMIRKLAQKAATQAP